MKKSTPIFQVPQVYIDLDKRANDEVCTQSLYLPPPPLLRRMVQKSLHPSAFYHHCSDTYCLEILRKKLTIKAYPFFFPSSFTSSFLIMFVKFYSISHF